MTKGRPRCQGSEAQRSLPCFRAEAPKRGPDHRLEEDGKTDEQVTDDLWKPPGVLFSVFPTRQNDLGGHTEGDIQGEGKALVISLDSHIRRENLDEDCKDRT